MTLIKNIVKISGGYSDVVDLTNQYTDPKMNSELMERYKPIKAHRDAFEKIANSLNQTDKRFYFLSGSYGTGKSHLCLMAANYFANPSNTMEMNTFFKNYDQAQNDVKLKPGESLSERSAKELQARRKEGKYLVAICRYGLTLEFEGTVLRAVEEALSNSGIELDTHYREALRKIKEWHSKQKEKSFYSDLKKYLANNHKGWTVEDLETGLKEDKEEALKIFKLAHKEVTSADFSYNRDNLQDILKDILSNDKFKKMYKGLVLLYDEFGYALDDNLVNLKKMQEFAQFCATSNMTHHPVVFIGTGHKAFRNHGQVGDAVHYDTISARVVEIPLQTQGMEDIIGAIVSPQKSSKSWKTEVEPNRSVFESFTGECNRLKLFNWLKAPIIENNIIQNIYPVHPLATYALLQLAKEVSSDNRSVYQFFSVKTDDKTGEWVNVTEHSYPWFISNHQIIADEKLNLYTTDLLYEYFKDGIKTDNKKISDPVKQTIKDYNESLKAFTRYIAEDSKDKLIKQEDADELFYRILKTILINEIISNEVTPISNTKENIFFALNATSVTEKEAISKRLDILSKISVVHLTEGVYELRKSDTKDIQRMVNDFKADPKNHPANLLEEFLKYVPLTSDEEYLEAKDYNTTYNEDKRLKCLFIKPSSLTQKEIVEGNELDFFEKCEYDRKKAGIGTEGYEGTAVYLFCQSDEEIEDSKKLARENSSKEIAICIPKKPFNILSDIQTLKALDTIKDSDEYKNFGLLENAQINELKRIAVGNLRDSKQKWFENKLTDWYRSDGTHEKVNDSKKHDIANKIVEEKFHKTRTKFTHTDFNKSHTNLSTAIKRILNESIETLMDLSKGIGIEWKLPENRGDTKYIRKCFVDHQLIRLLKESGEYRFFEPETDFNKFKKTVPAYEAMLKDIEAMQDKGPSDFNAFILKYYEEYGLGEIAVSLMFLLARRYYGDALRIKKNVNDYVDLTFNDPAIPLELVSLKYTGAVIQYEKISEDQKKYFYQIHQIFDPNNTEAGKVYGISECYEAAKNWWAKIPEISKIESSYKDDSLNIIKTFSGIESADPYSFIKKDLMECLGYQANEVINDKKLKQIKEKLDSFKEKVESKEEQLKDVIRKDLKEIFNAETPTDLDIVDAIRKWYNDGLDKYQKDQFADFHNNESKALIKKISGINNQTEFLFKTLPDLFGLDSFENWKIDKTIDYINKIKAGKKHLEENSSPVGEIKVDIKGKVEKEEGNIKHKGGFEIEVRPEHDKDIIYYTEDGSDPADEKSQRKQVKKGDKIQVYGNRTIKFVVKDPTGKYGKTKSYTAIDESQKCKAFKEKSDFFGSEKLSFVFPQDESDIKVALSSVLAEIISANLITKDKLEKLVNQILKDLKK